LQDLGGELCGRFLSLFHSLLASCDVLTC
jgi:hypothetical protein